jgi:hypothetical protein
LAELTAEQRRHEEHTNQNKGQGHARGL